MGALGDVLTLVQSEWGWLLVLAFLTYEVLWPERLWKTKFHKTVDRIESKVVSVENKVEDVDDKQTALIQVVRALSREESGIKDENVDEYLVENGVEPEYFLTDDRGETSDRTTEYPTVDD